MRKFMAMLTGVVLLAAGAAWANNCPNEMKAIDAKLKTNPQLSKEDAEKVAKLRSEGEARHKEGKHDDSMKALTEAKKILGI